jgi:two-component system sensor histidine kinase CpxA
MRLVRRSLFVKIFLWFCLTATVATLLVLAAASLTGSQPFGRRWSALTQDLYAHSALDFYLAGGPPALENFLHTIQRNSGIEGHLLDASGGDVLGQPFPDHTRSVYLKARQSGHSSAHLGRYWTAASPVTAADGRHFMFLMEAFPLRGFLDGTFFLDFVPRLIAGLLLAALLCLLLARHITRPIRILEQATTRMAAGDFGVRTLPSIAGRRDELASMAAAFDSMAERIELLLTTQRQMLADISHELRSPLTRIAVSLELLRRGEQDVLEPMQADLERLNTMIGQILELARFDLQSAGGAADSGVDLCAVLEDVLESGNYEGRGKQCTVTLAAQGPAFVSGAYDALRSCFENIVRNAIFHAPPGSAVGVRLVTAEPGTILVRIDDAGPGVPPESLASIFTPFFRVLSGEGPNPYSSGLGLSISSRIVMRYGGAIHAENRSPHGLSVIVRLPARIQPM